MDPRALNVLLVIADAQEEADIRQKLAGARNTSFAVHAVSSLAHACKLISDKPFDTFLIDLAVPDSDGISGLQHLVAAARYAPVIIITSVYDESQALEVVRAGAEFRVSIPYGKSCGMPVLNLRQANSARTPRSKQSSLGALAR
jgi:DNA-binding NarL/FixJ family response regulator